jgi:hypothetical protein
MAQKKEGMKAKGAQMETMNSMTADTLFASDCRRLASNGDNIPGSVSGPSRSLRTNRKLGPIGDADTHQQAEENQSRLLSDGDGSDGDENVGFVIGYLGPDLGKKPLGIDPLHAHSHASHCCSFAFVS